MKDLFKSKGFTTGFILLSILILFLTAVLVYLLSGRGPNGKPQISTYDGSQDLTSEIRTDPVEEIPSDSASPEPASLSTETVTGSESESQSTSGSETQSVSGSEAQSSSDSGSQGASVSEPQTQHAFRGLEPDEKHIFPVMNEVIPERGKLTVHRSEGLIFHTKPQFDRLEENNNILVNDGEFEVVGKIFVRTNSGTPAMMYKTKDGYYTTSDPELVSYQAEHTTFVPNRYFVGTYGSSAGKGIVVQVFSEDGNHVAFSIYNDNGGTLTPAVENIVAEYEDSGWGNFEFMYTDGKVYEGMIEFHNTVGIQVEINLGTSCEFDAGSRNFILLNHD